MAADGVFCIEADWYLDLRRKDSMEPGLLWLERLGRIKYIHRDIGNREELAYYLKEWTLKRYDRYPVLYLGFHGTNDGSAYVGRQFIELSEILEPLGGKCQGRTILLGSCSLMGQNDAVLKRHVAATGARAIIGYSREVDWLESAAFELLLIDRILVGDRTDASFRSITRNYGQLASTLGLVAAVKTQVYRADAAGAV